MSNALAIAAVTAALKDRLNTGLLNLDLSAIGSVSVSALPPDRITTGQMEPNQLNLFLYQVMPNSGWRNRELPSRDAVGVRLGNPPLALDLHYMLTAYGAQDLGAEVLLGYAMQFLHETPMLTRQQLRSVLGPPSPFGNLSALSLADQVEWLKITPLYLGAEELSKLWTATQARYRPSMAYQVSVVLIQGEAPAKSALPVLKRGVDDRGPAALAAFGPTLGGVRPLASDLLPAARLGDDLLLRGSQLGEAGLSVIFEAPRLGIVRELAPLAASGDAELRVHLPTPAEDPAVLAEWASGVYQVSLRVTRPDLPVWRSNTVPLALAPRITVSPLNAAAGTVQLTVTCMPRLRGVQETSVRLVFGQREIAPGAVNTPNDPAQPTTLDFTVPQVAAGSYPVRLRVEGIDSLPVTMSGLPPVFDFDPQQTVTVA